MGKKVDRRLADNKLSELCFLPKALTLNLFSDILLQKRNLKLWRTKGTYRCCIVRYMCLKGCQMWSNGWKSSIFCNMKLKYATDICNPGEMQPWKYNHVFCFFLLNLEVKQSRIRYLPELRNFRNTIGKDFALNSLEIHLVWKLFEGINSKKMHTNALNIVVSLVINTKILTFSNNNIETCLEW